MRGWGAGSWAGRLALAGVVLAFASVVAPSAASAATPTLTVAPNWGLGDGQTVTVTATHYPPNVSLDLVQCDIVYGCDPRLSFYGTNSSGTGTTHYAVSRLIHPNHKTVDCAKTGHCVLVSIDITHYSAGAQAGIHFDKNKPILPPLDISMSLDATDGVVVSSGVAIVHGNVTCNRAAEVYVYSQLNQSVGGTIAQGYGNSEVECDGAETVTWQLSINPQNHEFATGAAQVYANADGSTSNSSDYTSATGTVVLQAANLPILKPSGATVAVPAPGHTVVLHYWIVLSAASQYPVSFRWSTLNGTASAPDDYVSASGFATIPPGSTKAIVPITINGNSKSAGTRRFVVSLSDPSNAALGADHGRGTVNLVHS